MAASTSITKGNTTNDNNSTRSINTYVPPCKLMFTKLNDDLFDKGDVCLVVSQNSVSYRNFGCTKDITEKYTYADVAGLREADEVLKSYAKYECRDAEGSVHLKNPKTYAAGPVVGTLITQYGIGRPFENNNISQKITKYCQDEAVTSHLTSDTEENRVHFFKRAIFNLAKLLCSIDYYHIKKIIFPCGIGHSGKVDNIWLVKYLPIIYTFASDMNKFNKEVILTLTQASQLDELYENRKDYAAQCYKKLKQLSFLTNSEFLRDIPLSSYTSNTKDDKENDDDDDDDDDLPPTLPYYSVSF